MIGKVYFGESNNVEFKREIPSNHEKFLKDIIAFSNCTGGKVILGIEDETNEVCGIGDVSPFKLSDSISTMISDACTPQIDPYITVGTVEEKTVLIIDVVPGKFRPYYLTSKGKETSTYIRVNGTSRPADYNKLKELELGDIILCLDVVEKQSIEYETGILRETLYMITHGVCHLVGYDHIEDDEKIEMRAMEEKILGAIGVEKQEK